MFSISLHPFAWANMLWYISKPKNPNWTYVVVNKKALYNANASDHNHFELHESEQTELVTRILALAGITLTTKTITNARLFK